MTKERRIKAEVDRAAYVAKSKEGKAPKTMATWPLQESPDQPVQKGKHICIHTSRSLLICFQLMAKKRTSGSRKRRRLA